MNYEVYLSYDAQEFISTSVQGQGIFIVYPVAPSSNLQPERELGVFADIMRRWALLMTRNAQ